MKKFISTVLILFSVLLLFAYSKPAKDKVLSVSGLINVYGNEPFTFIGLKTDSGEEYSLIAEKEVLDQLRNTQGKRITIKASLKENDKNKADTQVEVNSLKNGNLIVLDWEYVDKSAKDSNSQLQEAPDGWF